MQNEKLKFRSCVDRELHSIWSLSDLSFPMNSESRNIGAFS